MVPKKLSLSRRLFHKLKDEIAHPKIGCGKARLFELMKITQEILILVLDAKKIYYY